MAQYLYELGIERANLKYGKQEYEAQKKRTSYNLKRQKFAETHDCWNCVNSNEYCEQKMKCPKDNNKQENIPERKVCGMKSALTRFYPKMTKEEIEEAAIKIAKGEAKFQDYYKKNGIKKWKQ